VKFKFFREKKREKIISLTQKRLVARFYVFIISAPWQAVTNGAVGVCAYMIVIQMMGMKYSGRRSILAWNTAQKYRTLTKRA
jgi:hypothetical protein